MTPSLWTTVHGRNGAQGVMFGIEAEVEGMHNARRRLDEAGDYPVGQHWCCIKDGSLRSGGVEIVSRRAVPEKSLPAALKELSEILAEESPVFSVRTSTHVHVNVQDLNLVQIMSMVLISAAVEPLLQQYVHPSRRTNLFCIPLHMCSTFGDCIRACYNLYQTRPSRAAEVLSHIGKYSSINTGRLCDLGTIEFRSMHGASNIGHIAAWCQVLQRIRGIAEGITSIQELTSHLLCSKEKMEEQLFSGLGLEKQPGPVAMSYKDAQSASLSVLSSMKSPTPSPDAATLQYSDIMDASDSLDSPRLRNWNHVTRTQLRSYSIPPDSVLTMLAQRQEGGHLFDCFVQDHTVYFWILDSEGRRRFIGRYSEPAPTVQLEEVELTFMERA